MCLKKFFKEKSYKVEGFTGPSGYLIYQEGDKKMRIEAERRGDNNNIVIFDYDIRWEPPHHEETISDEKRQEIIVNLRRERKSLEIWDHNRRKIG